MQQYATMPLECEEHYYRTIILCDEMRARTTIELGGTRGAILADGSTAADRFFGSSALQFDIAGGESLVTPCCTSRELQNDECKMAKDVESVLAKRDQFKSEVDPFIVRIQKASGYIRQLEIL